MDRHDAQPHRLALERIGAHDHLAETFKTVGEETKTDG
jgi:hypothetical protein